MSENVSTGVLGKKVFFVYPNSVIQDEMLSQLIKGEYEIYLIKDYEKAVVLFHRYPDSVVFINIDEGQQEAQWESSIRSLRDDPELAGLQIGILTYNDDPTLAEKYLMDLGVSGFIKLSLGLKESTSIVQKVLEANEARGRRQFLRVKCDVRHSTLNFLHRGKTITGTVLDISSAGMACILNPEPNLVAHTVVDSVQLKLKGVLCLVSGVVMGTRQEGDQRVYIVLFHPKTDPNVKDKIRGFMRWSLQNQIEAEMEAIR